MTPTPDNPINWKSFLLALAWAGGSMLAPVGVVLWRWSLHWNDPPDWDATAWLAATLFCQGAVSFWRKNKALLQLPQWAIEARQLAASAQKTPKPL